MSKHLTSEDYNCVGDGWHHILHLAHIATDRVPCCNIVQVKEKYGLLRIYVDHDYECGIAESDERGECLLYESLYDTLCLLERLSGYGIKVTEYNK